jgi:pyrimidine operon attenuation protein/uracil phosphoribosyltransferase
MTTILNKQQLQITIERLACQIAENYFSDKSLIIIGIQPRGIFLADKIVPVLKNILQSTEVQYGKLDITFYRDDVRKELHQPNHTDIIFSLEDRNVVLIDDVLFTGRTIRASLDAMLSFGRPRKVELCVLINRRYSRELPIQPDYCGKAIDSVFSQKVKVEWEREEVNLY